jgi:hypothetical protein
MLKSLPISMLHSGKNDWQRETLKATTPKFNLCSKTFYRIDHSHIPAQTQLLFNKLKLTHIVKMYFYVYNWRQI